MRGEQAPERMGQQEALDPRLPVFFLPYYRMSFGWYFIAYGKFTMEKLHFPFSLADRSNHRTPFGLIYNINRSRWVESLGCYLGELVCVPAGNGATALFSDLGNEKKDREGFITLAHSFCHCHTQPNTVLTGLEHQALEYELNNLLLPRVFCSAFVIRSWKSC